MRRVLSFAIEGVDCRATLDAAPGTTGLLVLSGGNDIRCGPHRSMAILAQALAAAGTPVLRFDRRGVGDSAGENGGYLSSAPDLAAALALFRAEQPQLTRIVAFGNCDAASALILHAVPGIDAFVLGNPWAFEEADGVAEAGDDEAPALPPASAIAARYAAKLRDPRELVRLLRGEVSFAKLARGLRGLLRKGEAAAPDGLVARLGEALAARQVPTAILIANGDRTAQGFMAAWHGPAFAAARANPLVTVHPRASASHGFAASGDPEWRRAQLDAMLRG